MIKYDINVKIILAFLEVFYIYFWLVTQIGFIVKTFFFLSSNLSSQNKNINK